MEKNSIYGPEVTEHYPIAIDFLVNTLHMISDRQRQLAYWCNAGYTEHVLSFDDEIDFFKYLVCTRQINLTKEQAKAVLRVRVMTYKFTRIIDRETLVSCRVEDQTYMVDHPYWIKIQEQARHALELIKIK